MRVESGKVVKKASLPRLADPAVESVGYFHRLAASVRGVAGRCGATSGELLAQPEASRISGHCSSPEGKASTCRPGTDRRAAQYSKVGVSFYYIEDR